MKVKADVLTRKRGAGHCGRSPYLNGQQVIRLAIGNLATTWQDVEEVWELIQKAADEV